MHLDEGLETVELVLFNGHLQLTEALLRHNMHVQGLLSQRNDCILLALNFGHVRFSLRLLGQFLLGQLGFGIDRVVAHDEHKLEQQREQVSCQLYVLADCEALWEVSVHEVDEKLEIIVAIVPAHHDFEHSYESDKGEEDIERVLTLKVKIGLVKLIHLHFAITYVNSEGSQ